MPEKPSLKIQKQLIAENEALRLRLEEAEETLNAIRSGEVDAIIVSGADGEQIYTLRQAEEQIRHQTIMLDSVNEAIITSDAKARLTAWNAAAERLYGWKAEEVLGHNTLEILRTEWAGADAKEMKAAIEEQGHWRGEVTQARKDGSRIPIEMSSLVQFDGNGQITGYLSVNHDITDRKRAEEALAWEQYLLGSLLDNLPDHIYFKDRDSRFTRLSKSQEKAFGLSDSTQALGKTDFDFFTEAHARPAFESERKIIATGQPMLGLEEKETWPDGRLTWRITSKLPLKDQAGNIIGTFGISSDITDRKYSEEALQESEAEYRNLFENSVVGISQALPNGQLIRVNKAYAQMYGYANPEEMIADVTHIARLYAYPKDREDVLRILAAKSIMEPREMVVVRRDGTHITVLVGARAIKDSKGNLRFYQAEHVEITQRKLADERIQRQVEHLLALSSIDRLIASNFDLNLSLSEILSYVTKELGVDAADILLLNPGLQMLEYGAEQGFHTNAVRKTRIRLGESYAGRAALERQLIQIPDLKNETDKVFLTTHLAGEDFVCYFGVPLIAKGQIKGVMEIFHRLALAPDAEWFDFLNTLAGQTAIAIENSTLFESLQRSNSELGMAYDATIEGWSHALDLRDKETEGHTQRVTEMTMKLARLVGLSDADLVQVRSGALLHDIGKMGVPDGILLKPGPLTDEEWVVMKKHPGFAYEMLSPIHYLRNALDIPYCHHEKWDGSGYPRGLKGNQIPLVARIFAVVDVWDALRSDRPYRPAWPEEKVREYIRSSAGTHFDPQVVDVFLQLID